MPNWTPEDIQRLVTNPFYCINIAPTLCAEHKPMISEDQWVSAATKMIMESGPEVFLRNLLENLKGNYLAAGNDDSTNN